MTAPPLRIANCSGFYGDRFAAMREQLEGGPIDVLTGDYLAELTMLILWKARQRDPGGGYASTFAAQLEEVLGVCVERGVKVVSNAGGLNPAGLAARLREAAASAGVEATVAHVEGDDLMGRLGELGGEVRHFDSGDPLAAAGVVPITANAYLGGGGIARALAEGADVVVTGRVADASLVVGPAVHHFGWQSDDWDRLAGAVAAGHVLECGAQATGGNYSFFREPAGLEHPGFPIAEIHPDGSSVITKHSGTGGEVSVGTVTAQLLYEIDAPGYVAPDAVARFDTIRLEQEGEDRVRLSGVRGQPAPAALKVAVNHVGGHRNSMTLVLVGLDIEEKAALVERTLRARLEGRQEPRHLEFRLARTDRADAATEAEAAATLTIEARDPDPDRVGRRFSSAVVELALSSYPGFFATAPPAGATPYGVLWPALVDRRLVTEVVVAGDGRRLPVSPAAAAEAATAPVPAPPSVPAVEVSGPTRRVPLGEVVGARSGDKGGNANLGVWARSDPAYAWLAGFLTTEALVELIPEAAGLEVRRYELPNLRALNFVLVGLLGEGVAATARFDPQAKSLGEFLRSRRVDAPVAVLD